MGWFGFECSGIEELVPVTRAHALEKNEIRKITGDVVSVSNSGFKLDYLSGIFGAVNWASFMGLQIICLAVTATMASKGMISVGDVVLYQSYFGTLTGYVSTIISLIPTIAKGKESINSVGEILSVGDIENNSGKNKLKEFGGKYEFQNITFGYDGSRTVIHDLNLTVNSGETVALVGESGSGKTTIINLVIGFHKAEKGKLLIDGRDIRDIDLHSYREFISVVPQNTILFSGSIRDNITYGKEDISEEKLAEAIKAAKLESVVEEMPFGLDTKVGEHGNKLSGGQRQRIAIARAIIRNPKVIIFDEATSALDSVTEKEIQEAIDELTKDRTTFIVAHRLSTIKNADKIAVIEEGRCVEFGTWDELMAKKGEFYKYKEMQS